MLTNLTKQSASLTSKPVHFLFNFFFFQWHVQPEDLKVEKKNVEIEFHWLLNVYDA